MAQKDLYSSITHKLAILATLSGVTPGTAIEIDTKGYESVTFNVFTGTITDAGTAAGIVWELQESDTSGSGYTAVANDYLLGLETDLTITSDASDNVYIGKLGYIGKKRYLKLIPTGSASTDGTVCATCTLGHAINNPV